MGHASWDPEHTGHVMVCQGPTLEQLIFLKCQELVNQTNLGK